MIKCSVITIGDELLIGQVINTNSAWIAQQLNLCGVSVIRSVTVGDQEEAILEALADEEKRADLILITGGLGPTSDDISKQVLCKYFNATLMLHDPTLQYIKYLYKIVFKRTATASNLMQAQLPDNCTVMPNLRGTAPGMLFERGSKIFLSMPGVPYEMEGIVENELIPYLKKKYPATQIVHNTLVCYGISESVLAEQIKDIENALPAYLKLAYLPSDGQVRLRLSMVADDQLTNMPEAMDVQFELLMKRVQPWLISAKDASMVEVVAAMLIQNNKTISTAESCTGGYIAHQLTSLPGSSAYFEGAAVSYSYPAKENLLQVKKQTLETHGAVSEEVVKEMAEGVLKNLKSDYCIAVSGIMGPGGGMPGKPVGSVWVAVGNNKKIETKLYRLRYNRINNIKQTAIHALNQLRRFILEENTL